MSTTISCVRKSSTAHVFEERAEEYDSWFSDNPVYRSELNALQKLETSLVEPRLEIGVGPGHFAHDLEVKFGLDAAFSPLKKSASRGIHVCQGLGEHLPITNESLGTIFLLFSLCFVEDPIVVLAECHRVLKPGGHLVLGTVPLNSSWGKMLEDKKRANHPFYKDARFLQLSQVQNYLSMTGFELKEGRSTLLSPPQNYNESENSMSGISADAGFVVLVMEKGPLK